MRADKRQTNETRWKGCPLRIPASPLHILLLAVSFTASAWSQPVQPQCLDTIGVRELLRSQPDLDGRSVLAGIVELNQKNQANPNGYSFLPNFSHRCLSHVNWRNFYYYDSDNSAYYSSHASMIAGVLCGLDDACQFDTLEPFDYRGIAPRISLNVYEANWFLYRRIFSFDTTPLQEDILTISWGTDADDMLTNWWQRGIDALAARENCVIIAGCGNGMREFPTISKPSSGFNVISVGTAMGLGGFPKSLQYVARPAGLCSTSGPTADGRAKPDLIAPGVILGPSAYSRSGYGRTDSPQGSSSFAAPQVAGIAALLLDAARKKGIAQADDARLIKAILLNGANKLAGWHKGFCGNTDDPQSPLDFQQGAGLVNALNSYNQLIAGKFNGNNLSENRGWDLCSPDQTGNGNPFQKIYLLPHSVSAGQALKATLIWFQPYQQNNTYTPLSPIDYRLELWSVNEQGIPATILNYSDSCVDNIEHLYVTFPGSMRIALVVRLKAPLESHTDASYALAWSALDHSFAGDCVIADINMDGIVNSLDVRKFLDAWIRNNDSEASLDTMDFLQRPEDLNFDRYVDTRDLDILSWQLGYQSPWYNKSTDDPP